MKGTNFNWWGDIDESRKRFHLKLFIKKKKCNVASFKLCPKNACKNGILNLALYPLSLSTASCHGGGGGTIELF